MPLVKKTKDWPRSATPESMPLLYRLRPQKLVARAHTHTHPPCVEPLNGVLSGRKRNDGKAL
eukprot:2914046-Amphidinium_carterae.2